MILSISGSWSVSKSRSPRNQGTGGPYARTQVFCALRFSYSPSIVQGTTAFIAIASLFVGALAYGLPADQARALAFGALIASTIALVLANRTFEASSVAALARPNPMLWAVVASAAGLFAITLRWRTARDLFDFGDFHGHDILIASSVGFLLLRVLEAMKRVYLMREAS